MRAVSTPARAVALALLIAGSTAAARQSAPPAVRQLDSIFSRWNHTTPGCAAGVAVNGTPIAERAVGMADLEHDVANTPSTIFEAGSVSKQFTAAAVLLLVREGKLSLDDPVRKYIPELPAYVSGPGDAPPQAPGPGGAPDGGGLPLTVRHMLTHTSGLRDWGEVAGIAGWPRTTRVHTLAHVLDIVSRQRALNFVPGTAWSYSNTGYNLAAIIVSRLSGMSLADFSRQRLFRPLGLEHTSWRDDYTRIVKQRAIAYERENGEYHQQMPFENVYGNGGLLTTVGDLLKWNEHFDRIAEGDPWSVVLQQEPGHFNDGRVHEYALGLYVRRYRGVREVSHSGSTAGYRAFVARYPDQHVSVAVLCNAADANPTQYAHAVAAEFLGAALTEPEPAPLQRAAPASTVELAAGDLAPYVGQYTSDEAEVTLGVAVENGRLVVRRRPDTVLPMRPTAKDVFVVPELGTITFHRDAAGLARQLSVRRDRVWDLRFVKVDGTI